ncbi:MAG: serine/threonine-protein kinase [Candidatus Margulisiibacteriota bacterium]
MPKKTAQPGIAPVIRPLVQSRPDFPINILPLSASSSKVIIRIGDKIHILDNMIGRGGMADVYKFPYKGRALAAKYTKTYPLSLLEEGAVGRRLSSLSGFPQIYGLELSDDGRAAIMLMDFIPGKKANHLLHRDFRGHIPEEIVIRALRDVARQLGQVHAQGIIHRDIKPENILINLDPKTNRYLGSSLFDYGLATTLEIQIKKLTNPIAGTPAYFSPEQAGLKEGEAIDHRSDIYSLGITAFELLTGVNPQDPNFSPNPIEIMKGVANGTMIPDLAKLPEKLRPIIGKMIDRDPARRYQNCWELNLDLTDALVDSGFDPS